MIAGHKFVFARNVHAVAMYRRELALSPQTHWRRDTTAFGHPVAVFVARPSNVFARLRRTPAMRTLRKSLVGRALKRVRRMVLREDAPVVSSLHGRAAGTDPSRGEFVIDLHMHTTASDGTCTPEELVERAWRAGIRTMSVTDHDTTAAVAVATRAGEQRGMTVVPGIEITAVDGGRDVHVLAYFLADRVPPLEALIARQRANRVERATEIARRLAALSASIDVTPLIEAASRNGGKALARPQIARALVEAGHASSVAEAFDRYLSEGRPAYVPHHGASPAQVVEVIVAASGIASLAHPGYTRKDEIIPDLVDAGLVALEAFHSSHDAEMEAHYLRLAGAYRLEVTGGSDYHGEGTRRAEFFGVTQLPAERFESLLRRVNDRTNQPATIAHEADHGCVK